MTVTLRIGKQYELPRRPGDWTSSKGDMNEVSDDAVVEAEIMKDKFGESPVAVPAGSTPAKPAGAPAAKPDK